MAKVNINGYLFRLFSLFFFLLKSFVFVVFYTIWLGFRSVFDYSFANIVHVLSMQLLNIVYSKRLMVAKRRPQNVISMLTIRTICQQATIHNQSPVSMRLVRVELYPSVTMDQQQPQQPTTERTANCLIGHQLSIQINVFIALNKLELIIANYEQKKNHITLKFNFEYLHFLICSMRGDVDLE